MCTELQLEILQHLNVTDTFVLLTNKQSLNASCHGNSKTTAKFEMSQINLFWYFNMLTTLGGGIDRTDVPHSEPKFKILSRTSRPV